MNILAHISVLVNRFGTDLCTFVRLHKKEVKILVILDNIFKLLKEQGKTQVELAQFLGISKNSITEWRHGRNRSYEKYLYQIAAYLGTTPEYLKGETDIIRKSEESEMPQKEKDLISLFRTLSSDGQDKVIDYVTDLTETGKYSASISPYAAIAAYEQGEIQAPKKKRRTT